MDYSIGSLSDLITGGNTPNKKKVIKKKIKAKHEANVVSEDTLEVNTIDSGVVDASKKKKKKKNKHLADNKPNDGIRKKRKSDSEEIPEESTEQQPKKRKLQQKEGTLPKKSKTTVNAERRIHDKERAEKQTETPEELARTVFVGNIPVSSDTKKLKRFFRKYGKVDIVRIRGVPVANLKTPKKVAVIKREFHPDRKSFFGFVRYEEREGAVKASEANGIIFQDHHLRIRLCDTPEKPDENKAIFVGNLNFLCEEDDLWKLFESCGEIESVRIVRDGVTGIGKGFGYINFKTSDAVPLALEMDNVKLKDRELRISICNINAAKKKKKNNQSGKITKSRKPRQRKPKDANNKSEHTETEAPPSNQGYQGFKHKEKKRKNKLDKGLLKKKKIIKQVAPK